MKKKIAVLLIGLFLTSTLLMGCSESESSVSDVAAEIQITLASSVSIASSEKLTETAPTEATETTAMESASQPEKSINSNTPVATTQNQTTVPETKQDNPSSPATTSTPQQTPTPSQTAVQAPPTTAKTTESTAPNTTASAAETAPSNAKPSDANAIADKIIEYVNQLRTAQGAGAAVKLPGLTKVAQYRSKQLIGNFAHDTGDEREAAKAFKYGEHIVYAEYGLDYYETHAAEAIGRSGGNASIDEIAWRMASGFKDSAGHWAYVGAARNKYIAVGAAYGNGQWYICILVTESNIYG